MRISSRDRYGRKLVCIVKLGIRRENEKSVFRFFTEIMGCVTKQSLQKHFGNAVL
jgi:hypothetical protein